ncbi:MAG: hypothetical protein MK212_06370 [Saprospiraceae bacterium]|nr:hypothetical protein [Saprospiraceae bacterium]
MQEHTISSLGIPVCEVQKVKDFLEATGQYDSLSDPEVRQLAQKAQDGDTESLKLLVCHNIRFAVLIAKRYLSLGLPFHILINFSVEGLLEAAKRYNHRESFKFGSYATWWIRSYCWQAIIPFWDQEYKEFAKKHEIEAFEMATWEMDFDQETETYRQLYQAHQALIDWSVKRYKNQHLPHAQALAAAQKGLTLGIQTYAKMVMQLKKEVELPYPVGGHLVCVINNQLKKAISDYSQQN